MAIQTRHEPTYQELLDQIAVLKAQNRMLSSNHLGCLTRPALDIMLDDMSDRVYDTSSQLVFVGWDIDGMKQANAQWGETGVNDRLLKAYNSIRSTDLSMSIGTVWSGDEYMAIVDSYDAIGMAQRVQSALHDNGLSATFVIIDPRDYANWRDTVDSQRDLCGYHKHLGERDSIHDHR